MKASEVYLKAAEAIDAVDTWSCHAIVRAAGKELPYGAAERKPYEDLFRPDDTTVSAWLEYIEVPTKPREWKAGEMHAWRVLALLFMHQIAKDEEKTLCSGEPAHSAPWCAAYSKTGYMCTRPRGHKGLHIACGTETHNFASWTSKETSHG